MPKMPNQKLKLLYLSRIFQERTDGEHGLTLSEIASALREYGIGAERKSLYDDIEALRLGGMNIQTVRDTHVRYYLATRPFELAELCLMIDVVQSAKFLTAQKSNELIRKIEGLGSRYEATQLHKQVYATNRLKTENEEIYRTVATLHRAMASNKRISCRYFEWNSYKQRVLRKGGDAYLLSPWSLIWEDEYYYLVAYDSDAAKIKHFRVDKMLKVTVLELEREGEREASELDMAVYSQRVFGMYGGEPMYVRMTADPALAGVVFDRFGADLTVLNRDDCFEFSVKVNVSPTFLAWVMGFGDRMRILSPESVAAQASALAHAVASMYDDHRELQ